MPAILFHNAAENQIAPGDDPIVAAANLTLDKHELRVFGFDPPVLSPSLRVTHGLCGSSDGIDIRVFSHQFVGCAQRRQTGPTGRESIAQG